MKKMSKMVFYISMLTSAMFFSCTKQEEAQAEQTAPLYKDGTYSAVSGKDNWGGYADVTIEVKNGKITSCAFVSYDKDGKIKDGDYGKQDGKIQNLGLYKVAQQAVSQAEKYGQILTEKQELEKVEALSGATVSFALFQEAVKKAFEEAR